MTRALGAEPERRGGEWGERAAAGQGVGAQRHAGAMAGALSAKPLWLGARVSPPV